MLLAECVELGGLYRLLFACKHFIGEVAIISLLCRNGSDLQTALTIVGISFLIRSVPFLAWLIIASVVRVIFFGVNHVVLFDEPD